MQRIGFVCIDIIGGTIDQALNHLLYLPRNHQLRQLKQIRYCSMAGEDVGKETYVPPFPMLTQQFANERLFHTSQRPLALIQKTDKALATASIQGLNRLSPLLTAAAMVLAALGEPLSRAYELLEGTEEWIARITNLAFEKREARAACLLLLQFLHIPAREQEVRSEVLRNKFAHLQFDPVSRAMFSAEKPMIDWPEVATKGLSVYIDLRGNDPDTVKEVKLFWVWNSLMEYIKRRSREDPPLGVVIDEVSYLVRSSALNTDVIIEEFRELCQVRKRNANVWLTAATQEQKEIPEGM
jgi:hypothetical protein